MCPPKAPAPLAARDTPRAPMPASGDMKRRRAGFAAAVLTPPGGMAAATTTKTLLGS